MEAASRCSGIGYIFGEGTVDFFHKNKQTKRQAKTRCLAKKKNATHFFEWIQDIKMVSSDLIDQLNKYKT